MKMRAAVLERFGEPLEVQELDLAEPRAGEVLVRLVACGVCHTDLFTASGADPSGYSPTVLGHEGAGWSRRSAKAFATWPSATTSSRSSRRSAANASTAATRARTSARRSGSSRGSGYLPDGTPRLSRDGEPVRHFMGCSTFAEYTVMPEIALANVVAGGAAGSRLPVRLRALDRARRGDEHGAGRRRLDLRRLRRGDGRAGRGRGLPAAGRRADRLRRPIRNAAGARARARRDRHVVGGPDAVERLEELVGPRAPTTRSRRPATSP